MFGLRNENLNLPVINIFEAELWWCGKCSRIASLDRLSISQSSSSVWFSFERTSIAVSICKDLRWKTENLLFFDFSFPPKRFSLAPTSCTFLEFNIFLCVKWRQAAWENLFVDFLSLFSATKFMETIWSFSPRSLANCPIRHWNSTFFGGIPLGPSSVAVCWGQPSSITLKNGNKCETDGQK